MKKPRIILTIVSILYVIPIFSYSQVVYNGNSLIIGDKVEVFEDETTQESISSIIGNKNFIKNSTAVMNFNLTKSALWLKFSIKNNTPDTHLLLNLDYPFIDTSTLYEVADGIIKTTISINSNSIFNTKKYKYASFIFDINIPSGEIKNYFLRIVSTEQMLVPLILGSREAIIQEQQNRDILNSLYMGILLTMLFYNTFLFFSTKDKSYLYYVLYIFFMGLTQTTLQGYTFKYLWPNSPYFNNIAIILMPSLASINICIFAKSFLNITKKQLFLNITLHTIIVSYSITAILRILGFDRESYRMTDINGICITIAIYIAAISGIKKNRSAKFFLIAWSTFFIGVLLFILRNLNILPYSTMTTYTMQFGSAVEVILIAFALADRINILRKESERSRANELATAKENERLVQNQNILLEKQVAERTEELQQSNQDLNKTLLTLKETQAQLVQAEKMSSLGILTAGVAHEINNPINFVSSNIKPLELNIQDLLTIIDKYAALHKVPDKEVPALLQEIDTLKKELDLPYITEEIHTLLQTIGEGAKRTADIVEGLRNFSRLDESAFKHANVYDGIESTLMVLRSSIPDKVKIIKEYNADGNIDCYPGQLNQAFMNILVNGLQAIKIKKVLDNESITIKTRRDEHFMYIYITDTGIGMNEETKSKIFDPFFTTKDVGEGTGLGLSIVHKIIEKHGGEISVVSEIGKGSTFTIQLPTSLSNNPA